MPVPSFGGLPPHPTFEDVVGKVNRLVNELRNLLLNLDSLNVVSLTADHVDAGTLDAGKVTVHVDYGSGASITLGQNGITINNGAFDTFKADVNGEVTATAITIQSATGYPKIVMDPQGNLFAAYSDADNYIALNPSVNNAPGLVIYGGGTLKGILQELSGSILFLSVGSEKIEIVPGGDLMIGSGNGDVLLDPDGALKINNIAGYTGNITYVKSVISDGMGNVFTNTGTITITKGLITNVT